MTKKNKELKREKACTKFESERAYANLKTSLHYQKTLEWVLSAMEKGICSNDVIIEEIKTILKTA